MGRIFTVIAVASLVVLQGRTASGFPANEYEFSVRRDALKAAERLHEGITLNLTQDESTVDHYLQHLKWLEFKRTEDLGFPAARPIEEEMDYIRTTDLFRVLKKLPKGGNMHTHEDHQLSRRTLLELVYNSTQFQYLYMVDPELENGWTLDLFSFPPPNRGWIHVPSSAYTFEEIHQHQVFTGILNDYAKRYPSDSGERWRQMDVLWGRMSNLFGNLHIKLLHFKALYDSSLEENIQYLEARKSFFAADDIYVIDTSGDYNATFGKRYLNNAGGELEINITLRLQNHYTQSHPEFIGHKRIIYAVRAGGDLNAVNDTMQNAVRLHRMYPEHVVGFDLVAEEDAGNSHLFFLRTLLQLHDGATGDSVVPLRMHTAETSWPDDLITSNDPFDPVATLENTYDSILYGSRRIGHGLGFIKHPFLLNILRERDIAVEACPVSNQILGFIPDVRNHPALHYLRSGVPVVLGSDDPGTFGYDHFTIDWYDVFLAWGLDLAELKQLAMNSLIYSSMTHEEMQEALWSKWQPAWDTFIADVLNEACSADLSAYQPLFSTVLPREGALVGATQVHIYGRNFTRAICRELRCRFGEVDSPRAVYLSSTHIVCEAPALSGALKAEDATQNRGGANDTTVTVPVSVDLGDGEFVYIGQDFTYKHDPNRKTTDKSKI